MIRFDKTSKIWVPLILMAVILLVTFAMVVVSTPAIDAEATELAVLDAAQDHLVVKFKAGVDVQATVEGKGDLIEEYLPSLGVYKVSLSPEAKLRAKWREYSRDARVVFAEPNFIVRTSEGYPDDTAFGSQWHLTKMELPTVWNTLNFKGSYVQGEDTTYVKVAVIDSGVDADHPDLIGNLLPGINLVGANTMLTGNTNFNDDNGHGTHVAGIIAATGNNGGTGGGSIGVCPLCKILPIKSMASNGTGMSTDVAEGIYWATANGADIINMSLGFNAPSAVVTAAINDARASGVIVVAAAGNEGALVKRYPASNKFVIGVSATTIANARSSFSNMSPDVDLAAPGTGIIATIFNGNVGSKQGTSMATPNAAGVAALAFSKYPNATPGQLEWLLKSTATDLGAVGRDNSFGFGLVNAANALNGTLDTTGPVITNVTRSRAVFSGNVVSGMVVNQVTLGYTLNERAYVTAEIQNSLGTVVRVIENAVLKNAGTYSTLVWDGKNTAKQYVPTGSYTFVVRGVDMAENTGAQEFISLFFDRTGPVATFDDIEPEPQNNYSPMNYLTDSKKSYFSVADAHDTSFVMSSTNTKVSVINASGKAVRSDLTITDEGSGAYSVTWNGRTSTGATVPDGPYRFSVRSVDTYGNVGVTNSTSFQVQGRNPTITVNSASGIAPKPFKAVWNATKSMTLTYLLSEPAANATITITDQFGGIVFTANYGTGRPAGTNTVKWNGRNGASVGDSPSAGGSVVAKGTYTYTITMSDADSNSATQTGTFQLTR